MSSTFGKLVTISERRDKAVLREDNLYRGSVARLERCVPSIRTEGKHGRKASTLRYRRTIAFSLAVTLLLDTSLSPQEPICSSGGTWCHCCTRRQVEAQVLAEDGAGRWSVAPRNCQLTFLPPRKKTRSYVPVVELARRVLGISGLGRAK